MFLAESGRRRILLTGDGLGDDVVAGLEAAGLMAPGGTFKVDILKVPHHGSARNVVGKLFDRVLADTYVLSANGKYGNPDYQSLIWLVDAAVRQGRDIEIFATNPTDSLARLVSERPPASNHYHLTIMEKGATSVVL
jgi:beta-lactamase superfamily II metal-dependent hydrolase